LSYFRTFLNERAFPVQDAGATFILILIKAKKPFR